MTAPIDAFRKNIGRVRTLGGIYASIRSLLTSVVDIEDILRAQIVLAVSSLDHLIHEICRIGVLEIVKGERPETKEFRKFPISLDGALAVSKGLESIETMVDSEVRRVNGFKSFQMPDRIAQAVKTFTSVALWPSVSQRMGLEVDDLKRKLSLIVERRNKIAHESDIDPSYPGQRWPVDEAMVSDVVAFIEALGKAIYFVTRQDHDTDRQPVRPR